MDFEEVLAHYSKPQVREEIAEYCNGRWVALEGLERSGRRAFLRYTRGGTPLTINKPENISLLLRRFRYFKPRTIYASVNSYGKLENREDTEDPVNIMKTMPVWDVDASLNSWEYAVKASEVIIDRLDKERLSRSVYLKWSGRGIHIHVHGEAFSQKILERNNPLDVAFSVVEYILRKTKDQLVKLAAKAPQTEDRPLKIENKIDIKRVFTTPLSLHRQLDLCCVCFKQNDIYNFSPEWAEIENYRHDPSWKIYEEGEGDQLAEKALAEIGGYDGWPEKPKRRHIRVFAETMKVPTRAAVKEAAYRKLGRFQVMGLLQAARYYLIKGDIDLAKSFGLNRAIFYAWAKRHARDRLTRGGRRLRAETAKTKAAELRTEQIGNETAYLSPRGWFIIGGAEQSARDYDQQIAKRIEAAAIPYKDAWEAAIDYLKSFSGDVLLDQQRFYREVYRPVRDNFHTVIKRRSKIGEQQTLDGY